MNAGLSRHDAKLLKNKLMNAPVAPGGLAPAINVGTDRLLDVLEEQYLEGELADGVSCFKYLEGDYGTGKTQFIQCLAQRAHRHNVVTSLVTIGHDCPFSSPLAIYSNVVSSFVPPPSDDNEGVQAKGIEVIVRAWIRRQLRQKGITPGNAVPDAIRRQIERPFTEPWIGAPDTQVAAGLQQLGQRLTALECGAQMGVADTDLIAWLRGSKVRSSALKLAGMHEPASDGTAFQRLKTVIAFLRERLNYKGFFIAFDEGTRTMSFRRGTVKQRQAIENMLSMINQNAEGEFGGVMFMYAATPDFRSGVIQNTYTALSDRIGSIAFVPGSPMTPLVNLDSLMTDETTLELGARLMAVFSAADDVDWDAELQERNMRTLFTAQKQQLGFPEHVPHRYFVYHWCRFLSLQERRQSAITLDEAQQFLSRNPMPEGVDA